MQAVNNISERAMSNSSKPVKFSHLQKLANQSTLKKITKTFTVASMKAGNP